MSSLDIPAQDSRATWVMHVTSVGSTCGLLRNSRTCRAQVGGKNLRLKLGLCHPADIWGTVKIMVPFWVPIIIRGLI